MGLGEIPRIIRIIRTVGLGCGNQSETYHCHCAISREFCAEVLSWLGRKIGA